MSRGLAVLVVSCSVVSIDGSAQSHTSTRRGAVLQTSATAYCIDGPTKSGVPAREGLIAADPRVLPLGSVVRVNGLGRGLNGVYTVADTGRSVKGREIDIFMNDCRAAKRFGRQKARVSILRRGPAEDRGANVRQR